MAADQFTQVTSQSWFSRIGGAVKGIFAGLLLIVLGIALLAWNEGRAVKRARTLKEGRGIVVTIEEQPVDSALDGKLVHLTGTAETEAILTDPVFGIAAPGLKLERIVEMYQWEEDTESTTEKKVGGKEETTTTYTYAKVWSPNIIDSSMFEKPSEHENPGAFAYPPLELQADPVTLGAFTLSPTLIGMIRNAEPLPLTDESATAFLASQDAGAVRQGDHFFIGSNAASPQVGDLRISFAVTRPTNISVIARQTGSSFAPYPAKAGGTIQLLQVGTHTAEEMFETALTHNTILTWVLRLAGLLILLMALNMIFRPLVVVADVLPILGKIVGIGTGLISFLIALTLWLLTIAIAWVVFRPLLGISLLVIAGAVTILIAWKLKKAPASAA